VPFDTAGLRARPVGGIEFWPLALEEAMIEVAVLSMGNPHAVMRVDDVQVTSVQTLGPAIEGHARFAKRVNAGFMQVASRYEIALRVYERGAGETLACGTGACAAVVTGIRAGWLDGRVDVHTRGGRLTVEWGGRDGDHVLMTGPAETVYEGEIQL
jgi:diaminopimelate epimerase